MRPDCNLRTPAGVLLISLLCAVGGPAQAAEQSVQACTSLHTLQLNDAEVTLAEVIAAGRFSPPDSDNTRPYQNLPEFCRVGLTLTPSPDSDIRVEIWLPTGNYNGKYLAVGNGAFTGNIRYTSMAEPLSRGYATSSTDTGHEGNTAAFGLGHPEKVIDFGWRAVHEMAVVSKQVIAAYYDSGPRYSYWNGCSAGGRQAMQEAQRFPLDFDGIIAGAPGLDWTGRAAAALRVAKELAANAPARLLDADRALLHTAALQACDANDGVTDGVIDSPQHCSFDPAQLQCSATQNSACLSPAQVQTAQLIYSSAVNPATGRAIAGLLPGSELGWTDLGWTASARDTGDEQFKYLVHGDPAWTVMQFDFGPDIARAEAMDNNTLNALNPDLGDFFRNDGKLIQYHGWSDPQISPANATQYYERVVDVFGNREAIHNNMRLFMVPGMAHCGGGNGPNSFDMISALENWVEQGQAPERIEAELLRDGEVVRSRPLCPYPEVATYTGAGSTDATASFVCRAP